MHHDEQNCMEVDQLEEKEWSHTWPDGRERVRTIAQWVNEDREKIQSMKMNKSEGLKGRSNLLKSKVFWLKF